jgi:hypothetical protein
MRKTLILLATSTALTAVIGAFAWSAVHTRAGASERSFAIFSDEGLEALPLILASDDHDDDDDDDREHRRMPRRQDGDHEDEDDDDDDDDGAGGGRNPAPAGSVAPPQNGLFGTGAQPQVKVN